MLKTLLSRLNGLNIQPEVPQETPDLSRIMGETVERPFSKDSDDKRPEQLNDWLRADIDELVSTMNRALEAPESDEARYAFERAIHNIYGASGAYGGGALTRLTGSLQRLVGNTEHIKTIAPLINMHVRACITCVRASETGGQAITDAVCDKLDTRVSEILAQQKREPVSELKAGKKGSSAA